MANYNKNSVFAVSNSGVMPNTVDDLVFFDDVSEGRAHVWDEFERLMASGDYDAAHDYIETYADVHGYFGNLYNLMVNRIKAAQDLLILNRTRINNGTAPFDSFKKPEIFKYQSTPTGIVKDQVWIGGKDYFDEVSQKEGINKLEIHKSSLTSGAIVSDSNGVLTINGYPEQRVVGATRTGALSSTDVWSYWNYYVSGSVENYNGGYFLFSWYGADTNVRTMKVDVNRTANMHANLIGIINSSVVTLELKPQPGELYRDLKVSFMICKTKETTPNQKYEPYKG